MTNRRQFLATAVPLVAVAAVLPTVLTAEAAHPDAALIAMGRERAVLLSIIDGPDGDQSDDALFRLVERLGTLDDRIMATAPQTFAGLAVQMAVVWKAQILAPEEENGATEASHYDLKWLWTVKRNVERLAGGAA